MKNRKIVVALGDNPEGGMLVSYLRASGYSHVTAVVPQNLPFDKSKTAGAVPVQMNNAHELEVVLNGMDVIFDCAELRGEEMDLIGINTEITEHLINAALECGVKSFIHLSSAEVLGGGEKHEGLNEDDRSETGAGMTPYARSKFVSDFQVMRGREFGLDAIIVMPYQVMDFDASLAHQSVTTLDVVRAMVLLNETPSAAGQDFVLASSGGHRYDGSKITRLLDFEYSSPDAGMSLKIGS